MPQEATITYAQALAALAARGAELAAHRKFDLDHMRVLASALADPQKMFRSVLIAGTNGKGSTAATLAAIARAAGLRTGLYTSPHLTRVNERICILNGYKCSAELPDDDFARHFFRVERAAQQLVADGGLPHPPSFFETLTAMAFCAFAESEVELAVLEVGLGGRLDATNIVDPLLSVITDIDLDHTEWLGPTLEDIAREKCGILRNGGTLVTLPQHPRVSQVIGEEAMRRNVTAINAAEYVPSRAAQPAWRNRYPLQVAGESIEVDYALAGSHQQRNLALAIAAAVELRDHHGYKISTAAIARGIRETRWPGRLELLPSRQGRPAALLDVAHNAAGAWTLRAALSAMEAENFHAQQKTLLFGCLADKPLEELAQILFTVFREQGSRLTVILTRPNSPRAAAPAKLAEIAATLGIRAEVVEPAQAALHRALAVTPPEGLLVCAGSVYLVGELRPLLLG